MDSAVQGLKLQVPSVSGPALPRLVDAVLATPPGGVTLLVAAPGYGRTTLAVHGTAASAEPVAWVSGDVLDATPGRLLTHLEAATVAALGVDAGPAGPPDDPARWDALLDRWSTARPSWLVIDDVHHATDAGTVAGLSYLATRLPATVRLLLTSRCDLPALTADLRTSERFRVLDEATLALTETEAVDALGTVGLGTGQPETLRVARLCAGWPAAVAAVGRHAGPSHEVAGWLAGPGAEDLLSDWWRQLPAEGRDLLQGTVHLPRLHPELCDLTLAGDRSSDVLFALVAAHAHLRPARLGDLMGWVRHPLLTELLRHRAGSMGLPAERLRATAAWAHRHGDVDTEVRMLVAAGDVEEATCLVRLHEEPFIQQRRTAEVLEWYALLPPDAVTERAGLLLRQAWAALIGGEVERGRMLHGSLHTALAHDRSEPVVSELRGDEALLAAQLAMCDGDPELMLTHVERAEVAFADAWTRPVHQAVPVLRARALLWLGRSDRAEAVVRDIRRRGPGAPVVGDTSIPALEGSLALVQGRVREAHALATRALAAAEADPGPMQSLGVVPARLCLGASDLDLGDLDRSTVNLADAVAAARREGLLAFEVLGLAATARLDCLRGDPLQAVELLREARRILAARTPLSPLVHHLNGVEAQARISLGDAARAERLVALLPPRPGTVLLAVRLAQLRRPGSGVTRLERLAPTDPRDRAGRDVLLASAFAGAQRARAVRHLHEAAELAESCGLMTLLSGASSALLELAREEARRSADDHLARLLAVAQQSSVRTRGDLHLSAGERELLAMLPTRDSNDAIAARLGISVNTVKTRLRRLYTKLDVGRRDDAVRVARERGLID